MFLSSVTHDSDLDTARYVLIVEKMLLIDLVEYCM